MPIAAGITLVVFGAILKFALKGGHVGSLDLHVVGVILILAGIIGMLLPVLIRNRSRLTRSTIRTRHDVTDDGTRTVVNHGDGSQTLVRHDDGGQTFAEHFNTDPSLQATVQPVTEAVDATAQPVTEAVDAGVSVHNGHKAHDPRRRWAGSARS
jgi:hypothetical protein